MMKLYFLAGIIVIILAVLVLMAPGQADEDGSSTLTSPTAHALLTDKPLSSQRDDVVESGLTTYTVFVYDNEFSPSVMYANSGDTVHLAFATGREDVDDEDVEVQYDFNLPAFDITTVVDTAQEIEFVANKKGEFDYFCMTCSPQIYGVLVVN